MGSLQVSIDVFSVCCIESPVFLELHAGNLWYTGSRGFDRERVVEGEYHSLDFATGIIGNCLEQKGILARSFVISVHGLTVPRCMPINGSYIDVRDEALPKRSLENHNPYVGSLCTTLAKAARTSIKRCLPS